MRRISVQANMSEVKGYLAGLGYEVLDMENCFRPVEAVVYNGQVMETRGSASMKAKNTVLVNAAGLTPQEVHTQLDNRLS